jgi:hypothetical protein
MRVRPGIKVTPQKNDSTPAAAGAPAAGGDAKK